MRSTSLAAIFLGWRTNVSNGGLASACRDVGAYARDAEGLRKFREATRDWLKRCIDDAANAPLVVEQAYGMVIDIRALEWIARIEAHLDAKMQRLLTFLRQARKVQPPRPE